MHGHPFQIRLLPVPPPRKTVSSPRRSSRGKRANWFDQLGLAGLLTHFPEARKASRKGLRRARQFFEKQGEWRVSRGFWIDSRLMMPLDGIAEFGMTSLEIAPLMACSGFVHGAVAFGGSFSADGPGWGAIGLFFLQVVLRARDIL
jgi:hypothetical protein